MSFKDIQGQDKAIGILKRSVAEGRVFSNYLFIGPDGVGKSLAALSFAQAVNCPAGRDGAACEECVSCRKIDAGSHPDVLFVRPKGASSSVTIDQIRKVITEANMKPYEGRKKLFIIDDAHAMNAEASNAFLKTLEEPPGEAVFILISRSRELLLPTIVSRCHIVRFFAAPRELVTEVLIRQYGVPDDEAALLGNFSCGSIGKAMRMKKENGIDTKNRIIDSVLGAPGGVPAVSGAPKREELKEHLEYLISFLRDVFLYKIVRDETLLFNGDRVDAIRAAGEEVTAEALDALIKRVIMLRSYVDRNVNQRLILDVLQRDVRRELPCTK